MTVVSVCGSLQTATDGLSASRREMIAPEFPEASGGSATGVRSPPVLTARSFATSAGRTFRRPALAIFCGAAGLVDGEGGLLAISAGACEGVKNCACLRYG